MKHVLLQDDWKLGELVNLHSIHLNAQILLKEKVKSQKSPCGKLNESNSDQSLSRIEWHLSNGH